MEQKSKNSRLQSFQMLWKNTVQPEKLDIVLLTIFLGCATLLFLYGDIYVTIEHSFNFIDSIRQGSIRDFYQIALENSSYGHPAVYDIPLYFIFAIWNFPIYLLKNLAGVSYMSFSCLLWSKMLIIIFVMLTAKVIYAISKDFGMTRERAKWAVFVFLSSTMLVIPTFIIGQYDIISIYFSLLGIRAFIRNDEKWFLIWFLLANTMKLFSVFIFIPLLLLKEKRIIPICIKAFLAILGLVGCKLIYIGDVAYQASTQSFTQDMIQRIQGTNIVWNQGTFCIPFFLIALILICIFAYRKRCNERELAVFAIYIPLAVFSAFSTMAMINPYWLALLAPYTVLMMFVTERNLKLNLILDTLIGFVSVILSCLPSQRVLSTFTMEYMLAGKILPLDKYARRFDRLSDLLDVFHLQTYASVLVAILFACIIAFLVINFPKNMATKNQKTNHEVIERSMIWIHAAAPCVIALMICVVYVFPASEVVLDESQGTIEDSTVNLVEERAEVTQEMSFHKDIEVDAIEIGYAIQNASWIDTSSLWFTVEKAGESEIIYRKRVAVNSIMDGTVKYKCKGMVLEKNQNYTFRIYGQNGEENPVYVKLAKGMNEYATYESGQLIKSDLCLKIYGRE